MLNRADGLDVFHLPGRRNRRRHLNHWCPRITGGRVLGALIITVLSTVLLGHGYSSGDQRIPLGLAILVVVAAYGGDARLTDRV